MHGGGHLDRIGGFGLGHGLRQHIKDADHRAGVEIVVVFGFEACHVLAHDTAHVVVCISHLIDPSCGVLTQRSGRACDAGVIGEELAVVATFVGRFDQQSQVGAPVAGDDRVGTRGFDFGNVGCEVAHLGQRMQVFAHDLDVRALACQVFLGVLDDLLTVRIILVEQINFLDRGLLFDEGGHGFHFHGGICIKAEMPVTAFAVGEIRVHRRVVQENNFFARIALVVLVHRFKQGTCHRRAIALRDVAHALVDRRLEQVQTFGWAQLVVQAQNFKFHTSHIVFVVFLGQVLQCFELIGADRRHQAGEWIDPCNFDGFAFLSPSIDRAQQTPCQQPTEFAKAHAFLLIQRLQSLTSIDGPPG